MFKEEIKNYLIIFFIVVELLSMLFNFHFVKIHIGNAEYNFNFSVVFFCLGFFVVDIVADKYSPEDANKFVWYKLFSQLLFLLLGNAAISAYKLEGTSLAIAFDKSLWVIFTGFLATIVGYNTTSSIMSFMEIGVYQGASVFKRYLYSTIPGEILFSLIFSFLCFYKNASFDETMHIFVTSAMAKILLSIPFAFTMNLLVKLQFGLGLTEQELVKVESN